MEIIKLSTEYTAAMILQKLPLNSEMPSGFRSHFLEIDWQVFSPEVEKLNRKGSLIAYFTKSLNDLYKEHHQSDENHWRTVNM